MARSTSVYTATRRETGEQYVGISVNPQRRWAGHKSRARSGSQGYFHRALAKYGSEAFDFKVVATLPSLEEAQIAERILIAVSRPEYNLSAGGDGNWGYVPTDEAKAKNAVAHRGMKRPPRTPEHCAKLSATKTGTKHTVETRAKIAAAGRGRKQSAETIAKRVATRAKNSAARLQEKN